MAPEAEKSDVTTKQQTKAASPTGMNRTLGAAMRWVGCAGWIGSR